MTQHDTRAEQAIAPAADAIATSSPLDKLDAMLNGEHDGAAAATETELSGFASLGLDAAILRAPGRPELHHAHAGAGAGHPAFLAGRDLLVSSQTGSGKTAAFMLPAIQRISEKPAPNRPRAEEPVKRIKGRRPVRRRPSPRCWC